MSVGWDEAGFERGVVEAFVCGLEGIVREFGLGEDERRQITAKL